MQAPPDFAGIPSGQGHIEHTAGANDRPIRSPDIGRLGYNNATTGTSEPAIPKLYPPFCLAKRPRQLWPFK